MMESDDEMLSPNDQDSPTIVDTLTEEFTGGNMDSDDEMLSPNDQDSPTIVDIPTEGMSDEVQESDDEDYAYTDRSRHKKNGLRSSRGRVDMTPPSDLLAKAERRAKALRDKGQVNKSIKEYIVCTALCRIVHGQNHWKVASAHANLADAYTPYFLSKIQYIEINKSIKEYIVCTALCRIVHGQNHWKVASAHANLADAYYELKGYTAQALYHCDLSKSIMLSGLHTSGNSTDKGDIYSILILIYYTMARALVDTKKYTEAEQALTKARKTSNERSHLHSISSTHQSKMDVKLALESARLYTKEKKLAVALTQYEMAAEISEQLYGRDSKTLVPIYTNMSDVEQKKGRVANKERVLELNLQAHSVAAANYKPGSVSLVETALGVADAYAYLDQDEAQASAESYYNECLSVCTSILGPQDELTIKVQDHLARLYISTNRYGEALQILKSSLKYKGERYGEYSEQVSDSHKLMGSIHLAQGHIDKCLQAYHKCHEIECLVLGSNHKKSKDTLRNMDILKASPSVAGKAGLTKQEQLDKRPRFNGSCKLTS